MEEYNLNRLSEATKSKSLIMQVIIALVATYAIGILYGMIYYYTESKWLIMGGIPGAILGFIFGKVSVSNRTLLACFCVICTVLSLALGGFFASIAFILGKFPYEHLLRLDYLPWNGFSELSFPEFYSGGFFDIIFSLGMYLLGIACAFGTALATDTDKSTESESE